MSAHLEGEHWVHEAHQRKNVHMLLAVIVEANGKKCGKSLIRFS